MLFYKEQVDIPQRISDRFHSQRPMQLHTPKIKQAYSADKGIPFSRIVKALYTHTEM